MSVVALAIGSRGDVQPMAVLAGALAASGVPAKVVALAEYGPLVTSLGAGFVPVDATLAEAFDRMEHGPARLARHSSGGQALLLKRWLADIADRLVEVVDETVAPGDTVLSGVLTRTLASALVTSRGCRAATFLYSAQLPTMHRDSYYYAHLFTPWQRYNRWGVHINWRMATNLARPASRLLRERLGLADLRPAAATRDADRQPLILAASPLVVPPAPDWPANVRQTGFLTLPRLPFSPDPDLLDYLAGGSRPVFVGFGSMAGASRGRELALVTAAARLAGCRAIVPAYGRTGRLSERVFAVGETPHPWLLPRTAGVVHHGGAGTTHEALRAGVGTVAVPFGLDQTYHAARLRALGVGPAPIQVTRLTARALAGLFTELTSGRYTARATEVAEQLRAEDGVAAAVRALDELGFLPG